MNRSENSFETKTRDGNMIRGLPDLVDKYETQVNDRAESSLI